MKEGIGRALEIFSGVKISLAIVFNLECAELSHQISGVFDDGSSFKSPTGVDYSIQKWKTVQESPSSTTSPGVGSEEKKEQGQLLGTYVTQNVFIN